MTEVKSMPIDASLEPIARLLVEQTRQSERMEGFMNLEAERHRTADVQVTTVLANQALLWTANSKNNDKLDSMKNWVIGALFGVVLQLCATFASFFLKL